ncbi:glycosyltransferase [Clostridium sp. MCC353]|uniref:glycosyltransferase family 2 protein n=1 Tax=Clostridium sp. MCC353 TaxID=2592646 RepID=UPI001C01738C|nr:glycosyltransferase [Clostridium sp. MCC353]MBT9777079.1 glycosyltransferase [Clostridium sp. MCC353]
MENTLVSVILPIYNVEKYLDICIKSVVNQTYKNIEIILVNDGSKDTSPLICDSWSKKDDRIHLINKANAGLGMARNSGLDVAHGKYVVFVDSDDFIEHNAIEKLLGGLGASDTAFCGHYNYYDDEHIEKLPIRYKGQMYSGEDVQKKILLEMMGALPNDPVDTMLPVSVWHGIYSMDIINRNNIRFPSERQFISEDMIFDIDYLSNSYGVSFLDECLYYYRKNNADSLTSVYNEERFTKEIILYKEICRKLSLSMKEQDYILRVQRTFLGRVRSCIVRAVKQSDNPRRELIRICDNAEVREVLRNYPYRKNKVTLKVFNFCMEHRLIWVLQLLILIREN